MCEQATLDLITKVTAEKVAAKETFTAYDVSKAVQALQTTQGLAVTRHIEIGSEIYRAMALYLVQSGGNYFRASLPIAGQYAWFYYPVGSDPRTYRAALIAANPALDPPPVVQPSTVDAIDAALSTAMDAITPNQAGVMQPDQSAS